MNAARANLPAFNWRGLYAVPGCNCDACVRDRGGLAVPIQRIPPAWGYDPRTKTEGEIPMHQPELIDPEFCPETKPAGPLLTVDAPLSQRIHSIRARDLEWPFNGKDQPHFKVHARYPGTYPQQIEVSPFPCYGHNSVFVHTTAALVEVAFPIGFQPNYYLPDYDTTQQVNGWCDRHWPYIADRPSDVPAPWEPYIILCGKRIPPHPAMTRYLIAHEYGHAVQYWLEHLHGVRSNNVTEFDRFYARLRGLPEDTAFGYGGGRWHSFVGELIANDFRICVCGVEMQYWPHPGEPRPGDLPRIMEFWQQMRADYASADPAFVPAVKLDLGGTWP